MIRPGRLLAVSRLITGFLLFLLGSVVFPGLNGPAFSDPADDLILGEACFMAGDLVCAEEKLEDVAESGQARTVERALYLLGRVHLLTGDFRQSKEFFERAAEKDLRSAGRWLALVGIGDALFGAGRHEEALRRYRFALSETPPDVDNALVQVKIALCQYQLGRRREATALLGEVLTRIGPLSGWAGREEDFFHSLSVMGMGPSTSERDRFVLLLGPVEGNPDLSNLLGPGVPVKESRKGDEVFLEIGPLDDEVQVMILSESLKASFPFPVEIVTR